MRWFAVALLLAGALAAGSLAEKPRVPRAAVAEMEKSFNQRIMSTFRLEDPLDLVGSSRGVYLENYGAVFSAEVSLVVSPISPFRPSLTPGEVQELRQKKLNRLPALKQTMRQMLIDSAVHLQGVLPNEQIVVAVSLAYQPWENRTGLPDQILMQAPRQKLLEFSAGQISEAALDSALKVGEY